MVLVVAQLVVLKEEYSSTILGRRLGSTGNDDDEEDGDAGMFRRGFLSCCCCALQRWRCWLSTGVVVVVVVVEVVVHRSYRGRSLTHRCCRNLFMVRDSSSTRQPQLSWTISHLMEVASILGLHESSAWVDLRFSKKPASGWLISVTAMVFQTIFSVFMSTRLSTS